MAIKKTTWNNLVTQIDAQDIFDDSEQELIGIDNKINAYTSSIRAKELRDLMKYVDDHILKPNEISYGSDTNIWKDLPIWVSTWKEKDRRFILLLKNKLREYLAFYVKILTDSGVQRALVYSKEYSNEGSSDSTERGLNSETPQNSNLYDSQHPESDSLFDQAIADYASNINKNKGHSQSETSGSSSTNVTGVTWEEGKKNLDLLFFNELKEYIMSLPDRIYNFYSIDTLPAPELCKRWLAYRKEILENLESDE